MTRLLIGICLFCLLFVLAACAPFTARLDRDGDVVTIIVTAGQEDLSLVGVTIVGEGLVTPDPRCDAVGNSYSCDLGSVPAGASRFLLVSGVDVGCIATGYAGPRLTEYRLARCEAL